MKSWVNIKVKRFFEIVDFQHLRLLKKAIEIVLAIQGTPQLSVLGKLGTDRFLLNKKETHIEQDLKAYWDRVFGVNTDLGIFDNPQLGVLFVAGPMTSQFLNDISGKPLGAMSAGPYGILRGLGVNEDKVYYYLKLLQNGHYLLFVRTDSQQWKMLEEQLRKLK